MSRLDLVAGPNGAGKTTFVELVLGPERPDVPFVNADVIAAQRWPEDPAGHAYEAARMAAATRTELLRRGVPFIAETVFSHPSKLELIDEALAVGFDVRLHVLMVPVELSVARIAYRVEAGGHAVPEGKVRQRYERLWPLVAAAALRVQAARFYANERFDGPRLVATFFDGVPQGDVAWPPWSHPDLPRVLGGAVPPG